VSSRVGVEIGGTFTDLVWQLESGEVRHHKVLTTPAAPHEGALKSLDEASVALEGVSEFVHGSTIATNALLTRRGVRTGLLVTEGFRDLLEIARHDRLGSVYELAYRRPEPFVPRRWVREVSERIRPSGSVLRPLDSKAAELAIRDLVDQGVEALAVCLLHAYRNPAHEQAVAEIARRWPDLFVSVSSEVCPEFREYERAVTTVINAYLGPIVARYMDAFTQSLRDRRFEGRLLVMQSSGGVLPSRGIGAVAVRTLLSGPAAGVQGASWFARRAGIKNVITLDMGGTSTDVSLLRNGDAELRPESMFEGYPIRIPMLDIVTVGAGGGSLAWLDSGGFLRVGPQSAGAHPGPACYGFGGTAPTVTDAQVQAGLLRPQHFLGGRMMLQPERAAMALSTLGSEPPDSCADAVLRMANANIAAAVRLVSTERGVDPRDYTLVAYGGAGPIHAALVADDLEMKTVLIPWNPGLVSAFGLLATNPSVDWVKTDVHAVCDETLNVARSEELHALSRELAAQYGFDRDRCEVSMALDMRYQGQGYELTVPVSEVPQSGAGLRRLFDELHATRYGWSQGDTRPIQVVNYRLRVAQRSTDALRLPRPTHRTAPARVEGQISVEGRKMPAVFVNRLELPAGYRLDGPAVVEEGTATTFVPRGWRLAVLDDGDLLLERG
jgi:N-methylhydantoinase A